MGYELSKLEHFGRKNPAVQFNGQSTTTEQASIGSMFLQDLAKIEGLRLMPETTQGPRSAALVPQCGQTSRRTASKVYNLRIIAKTREIRMVEAEHERKEVGS